MSRCCLSWGCRLLHRFFCVWLSAGSLFQRQVWAVGSTFRDFSSEWVVRQPWHTSFICRSINSKRKNIKKTKYILTDIHKHLHEGQNNGKEVTVLEDMRDHTEQLRKEWNYEQYIG